MGGSCKHRDTLKGKEIQRAYKELECDELPNGRDLNQQTNINRAGDTRWALIIGLY